MDGPVTSYLYLGLRSGVDWWETLNESKVWQDRFFYGLAGAYALIATIALVQLIRIEIRTPEYGWTTQKVFHLLNFLVNGVRAVVFVFRQQVQFLKPEILQALLLDLPGLLFLTTYTLLVRFWAEIYHQARSLPTDKLRPTFIGANIVIYVIQIFIWLNFLSSVSKIFFAGVSFAAAIGFLLYGGRLFLELQRFPIESKGRHKKLREVGWVTAICFTCFIIRSAIMAWAAFDKRLDLDVLDHPVLNAAVYFLVELAPSALVLYILRKLPPKRALPTSYQHIRRMSGNEGDNLGAGGSNNPPSITDFDEVNKVLKQLKQETFTTGEDADAWLKGIEFYFEVKKTPELLKATIADQLLSGPAKIWWDEYKKDNLLVLRQISWDTFKDAFKLHYVPACFKLEQMNKFQNLVQEDTVEGYANKFRALQPYGPTMTVAQLVDKFIRGLKPELTMLVGGVTYPSLEEAIRVFKFKEQVQDRIKHDREEAAKHWKLARENLSKQRERDFVAPGGPGGNVRPIPARKTNAPSQMSQEERERCRREDPEQDATCSSSPIQPQPRKTKRSTEILLILDFNRVLGKVYDLKERIPASAEPEVTLQKLNHQKTAVLRPGLQEFLEWCFSEFEIALWSSMAKSNVDLLMRKLLQEYKGRFLFIWNQDDCTNTKLKLVNKPIFLKDLSKVYQKYWKYQVKNTLLIDDSRYKGSANQPNTMICPNSFAPDRLDSNFLLEQLKPWLEGLLAAESVPAYVKENQMWNMWDSEESRNCMKILDKYFHK